MQIVQTRTRMKSSALTVLEVIKFQKLADVPSDPFDNNDCLFITECIAKVNTLVLSY